MKLNKKGFMMVEVVVVAAIILGVLTSIYTAYSKVFRRYYEVLDYYNADGVYRLSNYRDDMIISTGSDNINSILRIVNSSGYVIFGGSSSYPGLCIVKTDKLNNLIAAVSNGSYVVSNNAFKDYVRYLSNAITFNSDYIMILQYPKDSTSNYYSYLELEV